MAGRGTSAEGVGVTGLGVDVTNVPMNPVLEAIIWNAKLNVWRIDAPKLSEINLFMSYDIFWKRNTYVNLQLHDEHYVAWSRVDWAISRNLVFNI